jgi:hypothetical protein
VSASSTAAFVTSPLCRSTSAQPPPPFPSAPPLHHSSRREEGETAAILPHIGKLLRYFFLSLLQNVHISLQKRISRPITYRLRLFHLFPSLDVHFYVNVYHYDRRNVKVLSFHTLGATPQLNGVEITDNPVSKWYHDSPVLGGRKGGSYNSATNGKLSKQL